MKALSVKQPWAAAIVSGRKRVEHRHWGTSYRGPLLIHASENLSYLRGPTWYSWKREYPGLLSDADWADLHFGALLGVVRLVGVRGPSGWVPRLSHTHVPGRYHWRFGPERRRFAEPVPYRGTVGLFDVPDEAFAGVVVS